MQSQRKRERFGLSLQVSKTGFAATLSTKSFGTGEGRRGKVTGSK